MVITRCLDDRNDGGLYALQQQRKDDVWFTAVFRVEVDDGNAITGAAGEVDDFLLSCSCGYRQGFRRRHRRPASYGGALAAVARREEADADLRREPHRKLGLDAVLG